MGLSHIRRTSQDEGVNSAGLTKAFDCIPPSSRWVETSFFCPLSPQPYRLYMLGSRSRPITKQHHSTRESKLAIAMGAQQWSNLLLLLLYISCSCLWGFGGVEGCTQQERRALLQLRDSFYYPNSPNLSESYWSTWVGKDCCGWAGVGCQADPPRLVLSISLSSHRKQELGGWAVNGSLFAAFGELQYLQLDDNQISGWLEPEGMLGLKNLQSVNLRENLLTDESVSWILKLPSLAEVDLSYNKLRSPSILKGFCAQKKLRSLKLDQNAIQGTIDPCISTMPAIQDLFLTGNRLTGDIPPLGDLSSLRNIGLGSNRLSGVLYFSSLANLANLSAVVLSGNPKLEIETEHPSWVPSFQLRGLLLSECIVNRRSGRRIPSFLSDQKNLQILALSRTSIQGPVPSWVFDNVEEYLLLDGNRLSGPLPHLQGNWTRNGPSLVELSHNKISGPMPQNMSSLLPGMYHLNLSWNSFHGSMASFAQLGYLGVLDVSHNALTGEVPAGLTANGSRLSHLRLSHNHLEGSMLPKDAFMRHLRYLYLENNRFSGWISPSLANSPDLIVLNLRGNRLSGTMSRELFALPNLAVVLLSGNQFLGQIPVELCRMQGLRILDLSGNFFSGAVPPCFSNNTSWRKGSNASIDVGTYFSSERVEVEFWTKGRLQTMEGDALSSFTGIDLSRNQLTGSIPSVVGTMAALRSLSLWRNRVSGPIPTSFQGLERVESLDLSYNVLSGTIPPQISRLRHLSFFCVAYNNLTGSIPSGGNFPEFSRRCFEGNPGLCGQPLGTSCGSQGN